jgi:hypothetical protein
MLQNDFCYQERFMLMRAKYNYAAHKTGSIRKTYSNILSKILHFSKNVTKDGKFVHFINYTEIPLLSGRKKAFEIPG